MASSSRQIVHGTSAQIRSPPCTKYSKHGIRVSQKGCEDTLDSWLTYSVRAGCHQPGANSSTFYQVWRDLFKALFRRLPRGWKERAPRKINWACDAANDDFAVTDERGNLQFYGRHDQHINIAEAMALIKAVCLAPQNCTIWTDSKVAKGWLRRARRGWPISAVLSWIVVVKGIQILWLPSAWNPADRFTRLDRLRAKELRIAQHFALASTLAPHECLHQALECGEFGQR